MRVLVYSRVKGLENDTRIVDHLKGHRWVVRALGLASVPDRATIGRWWRRYLSLLEDLEAEYVLADAGYDSKSNVEAVEVMGTEPVIASNPRRSRKRRRLKHMGLLRAKRYLVEQFNGLIKNHVLKGCWTKPKGITKKTAMVTAGLISLNATAMNALLQGETSLKAVSQHWA